MHLIKLKYRIGYQNVSSLTVALDRGTHCAHYRCLRALNNVLKARYIAIKKYIYIYTYIYITIIKPVLTYGSEVWMITDRIASILLTWERKILGKIYGPKCENGVW
jgi:hypothetical protein